MQQTLTKPLLLTLILISFLDIGSFFMPMPVYTPLFFQSSLLEGFPHHTKAIMLGILVACYGITQLFSGPIFGELSDQVGRKKVLLFSLLLAITGCLLGGISLTIGSISLIYISRLLVGFASGTLAVVFAAAADHSSDHDRAKNLGYIVVGQGVGAALGPMIGGHLASLHTISWLGYSTPFYFMGLLYIISFLFFIKLFPADQALRSRKKIHLFTGFSNIYIAMQKTFRLRYLILAALFFQIGTESFYLAAPILAVNNFSMTSAMIGNHFLLQGLTSIFASWVLNKHLSRYFSSQTIYLINIILLIVGFLCLLTRDSSALFCLSFISIGIFGTLCWIHINNLFSQSVDKTEQGLIFGVSQALWSLGGIIGSLLVGFATAIHYQAGALLPISFEVISLIMMILVMHISLKKNCS